MRLLLPLFAIMILLLTSCHKDKPNTDGEKEVCDTTFVITNVIDPVAPSDYIMSYPGSWWTYDNGDTDSCSSWEACELETISFANSCPTLTQITATLPNTNYGYIYNNSRIYTVVSMNVADQSYFTNSLLEPFLDTTISSGTFYSKSYGTYNGAGASHSVSVYKNYEVVERLNDIDLNGINYQDIIHTREFLTMHDSWSGQSTEWTYEYYYARNVGIVRKIAHYYNSLVYDLSLTDHYIAPH
ncbi:MAG: hypothetical protein HYZ43_03305 [Flavobacteriia bacterium]|nr:hypothetical protein [Flavobacteriia bacterium]